MPWAEPSLGDARGTATAFLAGWAIATVVGLIPYVSGVVFGLSAVFGTGAVAVAVWRARGPRRAYAVGWQASRRRRRVDGTGCDRRRRLMGL